MANPNGRPTGSQYVKSFTMVRIPFEDADDQDMIIAYIHDAQKGLPLGRAIRNIIKDHMESSKCKERK